MANYLFLDEAGNLDFGPSGTRYFVLGCVAMRRPFAPTRELLDLKYDLIEGGNSHLSHFHASEDRQSVRSAFLELVRRHLCDISIDLLVVEKSWALGDLRTPDHLYPWALAKLLEPLLRGLDPAPPIQIFTDRLPLNRRRETTEKVIKSALAELLPPGGSFQVLHHESRTNLNLQLADYVTWAAFRKWERKDTRSHDLISPAIRSERLAFGNPSQ
jgi:hypothetical protein